MSRVLAPELAASTEAQQRLRVRLNCAGTSVDSEKREALR